MEILSTILIICALAYFFSDLKRFLTKEDNWIKSPMYPVFPEAEILNTYRELTKAIGEIYPQNHDKTPGSELVDRIKKTTNPKNDETLMSELKDYIKRKKEMYNFENKYKYMIQANIEVMSGKKTIKEVEESKTNDKFDSLEMNWFEDDDIEKEVNEWIDRVLKK